MSAKENKELIRKYLELASGKPKPLELLQKYTTDQALIDRALASEIAFPLYRIDVDEMIAEGNLVSIRGRWKGMNAGPFMGHAPTGREVDVPVFVTYRVAGDKIIDHWMTFDTELLLQQLGISQPERETL